MNSAGEGLLAPPIVLPPKDPTLGLSVPHQYKKLAEEPILQKLDLDCADKINQQWSDKDDKIISQSKMNKFSPKRFHPDGVSTSSSNGTTQLCDSTETMTRPPIILPPKDPTIGLDLGEKSAKPKIEFKMLFLPEKIDIDKINECYPNEDLKIINKNKPKEIAQIKLRQQSYLCPSPQSSKGRRKELFKLSKNSMRKSFKSYRTNILETKSTVTKNMKIINENLLDSSLVEKKIFNTKFHGTFKFKSPSAAQKKIPKTQFELSKSSQKRKGTPKKVNKKLFPKLAKKANYLKEIRNLIALGREDLGNFTKNLDAFKEAYEDRFIKIEDLLQKIEFISSKCKNDENLEPSTARDYENQTLKKSAGQSGTLKHVD